MAYTWHYYDVVLLAVVATMGTGVAVGVLTPVPMTMSVALVTIVAVALVAQALFVDGPVDASEDLSDEVETLN